MMNLNTLKDITRKRIARKRVGRGMGSKRGKTCGRGEKGAGSRSGAKRRWGKEGGNMPLFMKLPIRGFNNTRFTQRFDAVNLDQLNVIYEDGDVVSPETLKLNGFIGGDLPVKLLGNGELTKKVTIHVHAISNSAREKLTEAKIPFEVINRHGSKSKE